MAGDFVDVQLWQAARSIRAAKVTQRVRARAQRTDASLCTCDPVGCCAAPQNTPHFAGYLLGETSQTYFLYLMPEGGNGVAPEYRAQVYTNGHGKAHGGFEAAFSAIEHADGTWIIRTHPNENEARMDEILTSLRFGLPTLPFYPRKGRGTDGLVHDYAYICRVFKSLNTDAAALRLLEEVGLDPQRPHYRPSKSKFEPSTMYCHFPVCGPPWRKPAAPDLGLRRPARELRGILEAQGLSVRRAKHNDKSWRFKTRAQRLHLSYHDDRAGAFAMSWTHSTCCKDSWVIEPFRL